MEISHFEGRFLIFKEEICLRVYHIELQIYWFNNGIIEIDDFEIYRYGFETLIYFIVNISVALLIGIIFDRFIHTIVFLSCYCTLRQFTGGYHAKIIPSAH